MLREKPNSAVANTAFSHTSETQATVRRIALVFLAAAGLLIGSMIFVYRVGLLRIHAQQKMANQLVVLRQLGDFLSDMKDAETGQRGYLLTGDEPYLEPYSNALQVVGARVVGLRNLALSGELPKNRVERVGVLTQEKLAELARTIQVRRDKGLEAVVSVIRNNHGKQVMDEIRDEVEQMSATEARRLADASERERRATDVRTATFCA